MGRLATRTLHRTRFTVWLHGSLALTSLAAVENIRIVFVLTLILQALRFMDCRHCFDKISTHHGASRMSTPLSTNVSVLHIVQQNKDSSWNSSFHFAW